MRIITLEAFRDESTGEMGFGMLGMPRDETTNAATDGLLLAHDLLEHVNGPRNIGTIDDELEALGAIWYVRGQHGELRRDGRGSMYSVEQTLASDVTRMFRDHADGGQYVAPAPRTRRCDDIEDAIDEVLGYCDSGTFNWRSEFNDGEASEHAEKWAAYCAAVRARMRIGYRKAYAKWEKRGRYAANNQFWAIVDAVTPYLKRVDYAGQRVKLRYGDGEARCWEDYGEDV